MAGAARKTSDSAGGQITGGASNVYVNGQLIARLGDSIASHGDNEHSGGVTITGSSGSVYANNALVARAGDSASCGHTISPGSTNVIVG